MILKLKIGKLILKVNTQIGGINKENNIILKMYVFIA